MKNMKKIMTLILMISMIFSVISAPTAEAAKKISLNKKKLTLFVYEKAKLKLKNYKKKVTWSSSSKKIASVSKKGIVTAKRKGTAKITAKAGRKKYFCKVKVNIRKSSCVIPPRTATPAPTITPTSAPNTVPALNPATSSPDASSPSPDLIYDLEQETGRNPFTDISYAAPVKCSYRDFFENYYIWLCQAVFHDSVNGGTSYRGTELKYSITVENTGENDLAELGFALNFTWSSTDGPYPYMFHVIDPSLRKTFAAYDAIDWDLEEIKEDQQHQHATIVEHPIKKGGIYTYNFTFTIPSDAMNGDKDPDTGFNYPIMMYIPNSEYGINSSYRLGDEITIKDCKISVSDGTPITNPIEVVYEPDVSSPDKPLLSEKDETFVQNYTELKNEILKKGTYCFSDDAIELEKDVIVNGTTYRTSTCYREGGSNGKFFFHIYDESRNNMEITLSILPDYPKSSTIYQNDKTEFSRNFLFKGLADIDITKYTPETSLNWGIYKLLGSASYWDSKAKENIALGLSIWNQLFSDLNLSCTMKDLGFASYNIATDAQNN